MVSVQFKCQFLFFQSKQKVNVNFCIISSCLVVFTLIWFSLNVLNDINFYDTLYVYLFSEINGENTSVNADKNVEREFMGLHNAFYVDDDYCDIDENLTIIFKNPLKIANNLVMVSLTQLCKFLVKIKFVLFLWQCSLVQTMRDAWFLINIFFLSLVNIGMAEVMERGWGWMTLLLLQWGARWKK